MSVEEDSSRERENAEQDGAGNSHCAGQQQEHQAHNTGCSRERGTRGYAGPFCWT
jgi:hypothetical protein